MFFISAIKSTYYYQQLCVRLHIKLPSQKKRYCNHIIKSGDVANEYIIDLLNSDKPCFITRIGGTECEIIRQSLFKRHHLIRKHSQKIIKQGLEWSGIFPNTSEYFDKFSNIYLEAIKDVTSFGIWFRPMENYIISKYSKYDELIDFYALYPGINYWTKALKGKKVLIVHPFSNTIKEQYSKNREKIFPQDPDMLPVFDLITYKAVVSFAGETTNFKSWDEALYKMYDDISKLDFDICLLGCGAYGLPLGSMIYNYMHKKVIHVGGSLQLLFGIDGNLYHNYDLTKHLMNEYWVYPSEDETPKNSINVENSMYWKK